MGPPSSLHFFLSASFVGFVVAQNASSNATEAPPCNCPSGVLPLWIEIVMPIFFFLLGVMLAGTAVTNYYRPSRQKFSSRLHWSQPVVDDEPMGFCDYLSPPPCASAELCETCRDYPRRVLPADTRESVLATAREQLKPHDCADHSKGELPSALRASHPALPQGTPSPPARSADTAAATPTLAVQPPTATSKTSASLGPLPPVARLRSTTQRILSG